jgi:hypothetical protein
MNKLQNDVNQYISKDAPEYLKDIVTKALATESSRIKKELLEDAAEKEPRLFLQIDGYTEQRGSDSDDDGDGLWNEEVYELRRNWSELRVHIPMGTDVKSVLRLLKKTRNWIKSRPDLLNPVPCTAMPQNDCAQAFANGASGIDRIYTGNLPF